MALSLEPHKSVSFCASLPLPEFAQTSSRVFQECLHHEPRLAVASSLITRVQAWQGRATGSLKMGLVQSLRLMLLYPGKMASVGGLGEKLSIGTLGLPLQPSPHSHTTQSLPV